MAQPSVEAFEMNQIALPGSDHVHVPGLDPTNSPVQADGQITNAGEAESQVGSPAAQVHGGDNPEQSIENVQQDNTGTNSNVHANGSATQSGPIVTPREWKSKWLRYPTIAATALWTIALMTATIASAVKSIHHHGIISTNPELEVEKSFLIFKFGFGLLWTFIPSVIFQAYALTVAQIVKTASARQPYVELARKPGPKGVAAAEKTILLDYESYWLPFAPFKALDYNHYMLAYSFVMVGVLNLFLAPLTGHLFFAATVPIKHHIDVTQSHALNWESGKTPYSMAPVYGSVSSTLTYGGQPIPWTTLETSFARVNIPHELLEAKSVTNLTVPIDAYAAVVDCKVLGPDEFVMRIDDQGTWHYSFADRGCSAENKQYTTAINQFLVDFVKSYYYECDSNAGYTRVVVIGASHTNASSSDLVNRTAISCIPSYYDITGSLTVSIDPSNPHEPTILDLSDEVPNLHPVPPPYAYIFQKALTTFPDYVDPVNKLEANGYGEVIYNQIQKLNPASYMTGETLLNATASTFVAAFAVTANKYLIQPASSRTLRGYYSIEDTRVFVDLGVAWTVTGLLVLALAMLGWVTFYTHNHPSILYEPPKALVGDAVITHKSELTTDLDDIDAGTYLGKVGKEFRRRERAQNAQNRKRMNRGWICENWEQPGKARLVSKPDVAPFGFPKKKP